MAWPGWRPRSTAPASGCSATAAWDSTARRCWRAWCSSSWAGRGSRRSPACASGGPGRSSTAPSRSTWRACRPGSGAPRGAATATFPRVPPPPSRGRLARLLRPLPGRRLPRELRPRKVGLLARRFPDGLRDPGFRDLVSRIDGGGLVWAGNRCELFTDGEGATAAMLAAIEGAREEVLLESYIFEKDGTGRRFLEATAAAAARGLRVRVLADAIGSFTTPSEFWHPLVQ